MIHNVALSACFFVLRSGFSLDFTGITSFELHNLYYNSSVIMQTKNLFERQKIATDSQTFEAGLWTTMPRSDHKQNYLDEDKDKSTKM